MKRLLILPALLLAACAPATSAGKFVVFIQRDGPDLLIPTSVELHGDLSRPGNGVALTVDGTPDYAPVDPLKLCKASNTPGSYACNLGIIPEGKSFRLAAASGSVLNAQGFAYAGTSALPVSLVLLK